MQYSAPDSSKWTNWRKSNYAFFKRHLSELSPDSTLVDLGAGPLQFGDLFKRFHYTGVDFAEYPDVTIVTDLNKNIPLQDNTADIVTLSNTLEHIPYPLPLLLEAKRILKPGGVIIGTVPFLMGVHQAPYDFNRYTGFQLTKLLTDAGFTGVQVVPLGNLIHTYNSIELKFFDYLAASDSLPYLLLKSIRTVRRVEMRLMQYFIRTPSIPKHTEGYGFIATV